MSEITGKAEKEIFEKLKRQYNLEKSNFKIEVGYVTFLDLSSNKLTTLPEPFFGLKSLQKLYLEINQLTTLPEPFGS